jgi:type IV pilus assembly protein PilW
MSRTSVFWRYRGVTLIELMVGLVIGLIVTLAVFSVLNASEGRSRTATSLNDAAQSGSIAAYNIDRYVRSAGTGFAEGWRRVGNCTINATLPSGAALPRLNAFPAPFGAVPQTLRLAPLVVFEGAGANGSDVLMIMSGSAGFGEVPMTASGGSTSAALTRLPNTIGFNRGDLIMIAGGSECMLSQVSVAQNQCAGNPAAPAADCGQDLLFGGAYYDAEFPNPAARLDGFGGGATPFDVHVFNLGSPVTNPPSFALIGVGPNSVLFRLDLLETQGIAPLPMAEGVRHLHAVYGLDTNGDGRIDTWQRPAAGTDWSGANLNNGSTDSAARLRQIISLRLALVTRSDLIERELEPGVPVSPASIELFSDLPAGSQVTIDLTAAGENRNQRHRVIELTIPVRNHLLRTS